MLSTQIFKELKAGTLNGIWLAQYAQCGDWSIHVLSNILSVLKARSQPESTAEMGNLQRLILPLNRRVEGSSWYLYESSTQVLKY